MAPRPHVVCHITSSIDGRLHPSRYTASPDGTVKDWSGAYEAIHERLEGDAWLVGRTTMAEMAKGEAHPPARFDPPARPMHRAPGGDRRPLAIAPDTHGRLHFRGPEVGGDPVLVLLGSSVSDAHLAELAADGVSYLVSDGPEVDLGRALAVLADEFGVRRLLVEGGAAINGSFLAAGLVDELSVIVAPALDGGTETDSIVAFGRDGLRGRLQLSLQSAEAIEGGALHLRYRVLPG
ncbi:RibD family protein [Aureimonas flava]|uniref:RibD family protein n=1 Tax=Aureimonas flava TaxID=2320271 RepID=A0A3A1WVH0_9HYPH|nr:RibD family protein [Aureimonas flava]RIY02681.1 RibD family protein [Aureimonas flava]